MIDPRKMKPVSDDEIQAVIGRMTKHFDMEYIMKAVNNDEPIEKWIENPTEDHLKFYKACFDEAQKERKTDPEYRLHMPAGVEDGYQDYEGFIDAAIESIY
jgi:hypothetical protein